MDVDDVSRIVERIYEDTLQSDDWTPLLQDFAASAGVLSTAIIPITPADSPFRFSSCVSKESDDLFYRYWWRHSPFRDLERAAAADPLKLIADADVLDARAIARHPYYQEFLRRFDVGGIARVVVSPAPDTRFSIAIQRAIGAPEQTDEQRRLTLLWARHLGHALKLTTLFRRSEQVGALLADRVSCGFAVLDQTGRVLLANELFERLGPDGLAIRHGRLAASSADAQQRLECLIDDTASARIIPRSPDLVSLPRPSGRRPLVVRAMRLTTPLLEQIDAPVGSDVVVFVETDEAPPLDVPVLLRQLGLTAGEARLAIRVADGSPPKDVGLALGITADTVRSVLKKVFAKLDVGTQSQLTTRIARLAPLAERRDLR